MTPTNRDSDSRTAGSMPSDTGSESPNQKIAEAAQDAKHEAGDEAREKAEAGQHRLADEADALSDAIDTAASKLDDEDREGLARYARELSSNLAKAAGQLEDRSVDQLANDAKRLARDNPALYMLGSIAVGFGLSRFFKASAERDHDDGATNHSEGSSRNDAANSTPARPRDNTFLNDDVSTGAPAQGREQDTTTMDRTSTAPGSGDGREML